MNEIEAIFGKLKENLKHVEHSIEEINSDLLSFEDSNINSSTNLNEVLDFDFGIEEEITKLLEKTNATNRDLELLKEEVENGTKVIEKQLQQIKSHFQIKVDNNKNQEEEEICDNLQFVSINSIVNDNQAQEEREKEEHNKTTPVNNERRFTNFLLDSLQKQNRIKKKLDTPPRSNCSDVFYSLQKKYGKDNI